MTLKDLLCTMSGRQRVYVSANADGKCDTVFAATVGEAFANGFTIPTYGACEVSCMEIGSDVEHGMYDSSVTVIPVAMIEVRA